MPCYAGERELNYELRDKHCLSQERSNFEQLFRHFGQLFCHLNNFYPIYEIYIPICVLMKIYF